MFRIFQEEKIITICMLAFLGISIFVRVILGLLYQNMIRETDNMAATENKLLKQCKTKFANCYQLNNGVANISVFVDKFLNRLALGPFSFGTLYHLSGQAMLLSVVCAGIGICKCIMDGRMLGEILPFYIVSFFGLYLYFSISTVVDIKGKKRILKVNLVDYLENHLSARMQVTEQDLGMLYGKRTVELMPLGGRSGSDERGIRSEKKGNVPRQSVDSRNRSEGRGADSKNYTTDQGLEEEIMQGGTGVDATKILPVEELDDLLKEFLTV